MTRHQRNGLLVLFSMLSFGAVSCGDDDDVISRYCDAYCALLDRCDSLDDDYASLSDCVHECRRVHDDDAEEEMKEQTSEDRDAWRKCWDLQVSMDRCVYEHSTCDEWFDGAYPEACWELDDEVDACWDTFYGNEEES